MRLPREQREPRPWWQLLPRNEYLGWTPFAWLLYLPTFLVDPIARTQQGTAPLWYWPATIAGLVIFLISYFRGYWVRGHELKKIVIVQTALAAVFAPINTGSSVLFIYAGSFAGQLGPAKEGARWLLGVAAAGGLTAWLTNAPVFYYIPAVGVTLLIGAINLHFAQVGRAQSKLRLAQDEIEHLAAVAERERIARDLHDVLGHTLSLIILKSELASKLAEIDPARAAQEIRDVEAVSRKALQDVREAIRGYRATLEDEVARARALLEMRGVSAEFTIETVKMPRAHEETIALALREAVTNVVRHADARNCTVSLTRDGSSVTLSVSDDGRGAPGAEGSGLRGMRERIELLAGSFQLTHQHGTLLTVSIPVPIETTEPLVSQPAAS